MNQPFTMPIGQFGLEKSQFNTGFSMGHVSQSAFIPSETTGPSFKDFLVESTQKVNSVLQAPESLLKQAMTTGNVDVHDVMIANAKADLTLNVTTQVATKVMQAYDRISQIQI